MTYGAPWDTEWRHFERRWWFLFAVDVKFHGFAVVNGGDVVEFTRV